MSRPILLALVALFCAPNALAKPQPTAQDMEWGHWIMTYHAHKEIERVPGFLAYLDQRGTWQEDSAHDETIAERPGYAPCRYAMTMGFLAPVFAQNPDKVAGWLTSSLSDDTKTAAALALVSMGLEARAPKPYARFVETAHDFAPSLEAPALRACDLDMYWGATFASGDRRYVNAIMDVLKADSPRTGYDLYDEAMRRSAVWSLGSNMRYAVVERAVKARRAAAEGALRKALDAVWETYEQNKANATLPGASDGDFSTMLAIVDEENIAHELAKPAHGGIRISELGEAKRGDMVRLYLGFTGMELDEEFRSDVTYTATFLRPDGQPYTKEKCGGEMVGSKTVLPSRFNAFSAVEYVTVEFGPEDPLGTYTAKVVVTDNISGKSLRLEQTVELVE